MSRVILAVAFFVSILLSPWIVSVVLAIAYLAAGGNVLLVVAGGLLSDILFGAPVPVLHGFQYLATLTMLLLGGAAVFLRRAIFE
ncbi:MAG: hypothetical protein KGI73_01450 [Patescibacteria group bacterium]|nr:hypothetical protein [Patescibacteria group bacterium]